MASHEILAALQSVYLVLESQRDTLLGALRSADFTPQVGWYNGHYRRGAHGEWMRDAFPIPVISLANLCDIEIQPDSIGISTKLRRKDALTQDFYPFARYPFEAFGVKDYLADYYHTGQTIDDLKHSISHSSEDEIGFSFIFSSSADTEEIIRLIRSLKAQRFFY